MGSTWQSGSRSACVFSWPGQWLGCHCLGTFVAPVKTASNEKGYLDNSGHRPAMGRMWLSDMGHLSAVTGLSCRGSLRAVCPVLPGCLLGWPHVAVEVWASWKASLKLLESQPETSAKHSSKDKSHSRGRSGSQGWSLGAPFSLLPAGIPAPIQGRGAGGGGARKDPEVGRQRALASACDLPAL